MAASNGSLGLPAKVCFVCLGNICRSPMGPIVLRGKADKAGVADLLTLGSAGTSGWHVGEGADAGTRAALARRGYPTDHVARRFTSDEFDDWDLLLAMDVNNAYDLRDLAPRGSDPSKVRLLREFDPASSPNAQVPDPYGKGAAEFDHVLDLVEAACEGLLDRLVGGDPAS